MDFREISCPKDDLRQLEKFQPAFSIAARADS